MALVRNFLAVLAVLIILLGSGCCPHRQMPPPLPMVRPMSVSVLNDVGIKTVQQGSRLLVMISTDLFFEPGSRQLQPENIHYLSLMAHAVAQFACLYPNSMVYVRGYTDQLISPPMQYELSNQFAETIAGFLWGAGISRSRIESHGYGSAYPLANERTVIGKGYNRRIEIQIN